LYAIAKIQNEFHAFFAQVSDKAVPAVFSMRIISFCAPKNKLKMLKLRSFPPLWFDSGHERPLVLLSPAVVI